MMTNKIMKSKSCGNGLDFLAPASLSLGRGKSVDASLDVKSQEYAIKKPISLPLMLAGEQRTTNSSMSDFLDDPLTILRQQAWVRIQSHITKEKRLAAVMCLLVVVFLICYLPFWTVFLCLVRNPPLQLKILRVQLSGILLSLHQPLSQGDGLHSMADPHQRPGQPSRLHWLQHPVQNCHQTSPH